jgi:hypothetical protein
MIVPLAVQLDAGDGSPSFCPMCQISYLSVFYSIRPENYP